MHTLDSFSVTSAQGVRPYLTREVLVMTASDFLVDAAVMSLPLFVAQFLRAHIRLIQKSLLLCSVVAGLIGLVFGPQFLNVLPFSDSISSYSGVLIIVLFSSLFIGSGSEDSFKKTMREAGDTFLLNSSVYFGQYAFALLIGGTFMATLFPDVNVGFSLLMPGGFIGGHGTAATFGGAFEELCDWDEALTLGQTFATVGILSGVIFGTICINIATKRVRPALSLRPVSYLRGCVLVSSPPMSRDLLAEPL